jgi:hypothetical protein
VEPHVPRLADPHPRRARQLGPPRHLVLLRAQGRHLRRRHLPGGLRLLRYTLPPTQHTHAPRHTHHGTRAHG